MLVDNVTSHGIVQGFVHSGGTVAAVRDKSKCLKGQKVFRQTEIECLAILHTESVETKGCMCEKGSKAKSSRET